MTEQALLFGSSKSLVGVISEAVTEESGSNRPNVILLNAGLLHRIGPNRVYVTLLRRLSEKGYNGLRFDLSGIGDSRAATDGLSEPESRMRDIRLAMDMMAQRTGESRFILGGLCDGAISSFAAAIDDSRVVGMILIDAFPYRTCGYYVRHFRKQFFRAQPWINLLTGRHPLTRWLRGNRDTEASRPTEIFPPPKEIEAAYRRLIDRGVHSLVIYPGNGSFNDLRQFAEMFPLLARDARVRLEYLDHVNHTLVLRRHQEDVIRCVEDWLDSIDWPAAVPRL